MKPVFNRGLSRKGLVSPRLPRASAGFSLVEVVLSIGVVSFAMLTILGTLPVGIQSVQDSLEQQAKAAISQQIRSVLQQIPFDASQAPDFNIQTLKSTHYYYTREGMETTQSGAYYRAEFEVADAEVQGVAGAGDIATFLADNAQQVTVTLHYPQDAPPASQKKVVFSLFSARQKNN